MNTHLTVLVMGAGGNVSQGIMKALALSRLPCRVVAACIHPLSAGLYTADEAHISPRFDDPTFLEWIIDICKKTGTQAILSGVEPVIAKLAQHGEQIRLETGAICIAGPSTCLSIGDDKLATCQWLQKNGLNYPHFAASADRAALQQLVQDHGFPLIAKPCAGKSAQGMIDVQTPADLVYATSLPDYVIQECLGDAHSEYTVGCFNDRNGKVRGAITMRRELLQGTTYRAEAGEFPEVRAEAIRIAAALRPMGPSNIQIRISRDGRPVCFEINVRFSGTTPIRARMGFNDVEAALRHYVLGEDIPDLPIITQGIALRYWNEMYVDLKAYSALQQTGRLDAPGRFNLQIEDYGSKQ